MSALMRCAGRMRPFALAYGASGLFGLSTGLGYVTGRFADGLGWWSLPLDLIEITAGILAGIAVGALAARLQAAEHDA